MLNGYMAAAMYPFSHSIVLFFRSVCFSVAPEGASLLFLLRQRIFIGRFLRFLHRRQAGKQHLYQPFWHRRSQFFRIFQDAAQFRQNVPNHCHREHNSRPVKTDIRHMLQRHGRRNIRKCRGNDCDMADFMLSVTVM